MGTSGSAPDVTREDTRKLFSRLDEPCAPLSAAEVAAKLECAERTATESLEALADSGELRAREVDESTRVWWRPAAAGADAGPPGERDAAAEADEVATEADEVAIEADEVATETVEAPTKAGEAATETGDAQTEAGDARTEAGEAAHVESAATGDATAGDAPAGGAATGVAGNGESATSGDATSGSTAFSAFVQAVRDYAIFMLDPDGTVASWNDGAERLKGYRAGEIVGEHFSTFYTDEDVGEGVPAANLEHAAAEGRVEDEGWRVRADGSRFWANVVITAVRDEDGELRGFTKVTRDMTERREYEQRLRRERDLVERILDTAPVGIGVLDGDGRFVRANPRMRDRHGIDEADLDTYSITSLGVYDGAGDSIPVEDWPLQRVVETGEPVYDFRCEVDPPHGERRWLSVNAAPLGDGPDGEDRVVAAVDDVTEQKERERRLERRQSELEMELSEILDRIADAFYALDDEWRFTHLNERAAAIMGRSRDDLLGESVWDAFPDAADVYRDRFETAMETQEPQTFEVHAEGLDAWLEFNVYPSETGLSIYFRDVTERTRSQRQLAEERDMFAQGPAVVFRWKPDEEAGWPVEYVSGNVEDVFGYTPAELESGDVPYTDLLLDEERDRIAREVAENVDETTERFSHDPYRVRTKDGDVRWVKDTTTVVRDESGEITSYLGYLVDITERRERERELEESERRYRTLVEHFPNGAVALVDGDLRYQTVGGAPMDVVDATAAEIEGERVADVVPATLAEELVPAYEAALAGEDRSFETELDGRFYEFRVVPVRDDEGAVFAALGMSQDVTERRERERTLAKYETIVETINDGIYVKDEEGRFTMVNEAYAEVTGYEREELLGEHASLVVDEETIARADEARAALGEGDTTNPSVEAEIERADGTRVPAEATFATIETVEGDVEQVGVVRDVSERREYERRIEESERRYRTLAENFPNGVVALFDDDLRYVAAGGELARQLGVRQDDVIGESVYERYPEEVVDQVEPHFRAALDGEEHSFEIRYYGRDLRAHTLPVSTDGADRRGMLVVQDVTERREYQRQLEESNERLEQFAYAASHDLQEPLRMVSSYLQLLERRYGDELDADGREFIEFAVDGADRMRDMIEGLLEYSRVETRGDPFEPVALDDVLADVRDDLQFQIEESGATVEAESLPRVSGDPDQLRQVFQNLLDNAIEYSGDEPPDVHVGAERVGDRWEISVRDEGIGIDPDDADRVFEVFQRLHSREEHAGTGIGLALCERIVERHGGDIRVDSEPGEGATFTFTLPAVEDGDE